MSKTQLLLRLPAGLAILVAMLSMAMAFAMVMIAGLIASLNEWGRQDGASRIEHESPETLLLVTAGAVALSLFAWWLAKVTNLEGHKCSVCLKNRTYRKENGITYVCHDCWRKARLAASSEVFCPFDGTALVKDLAGNVIVAYRCPDCGAGVQSGEELKILSDSGTSASPYPSRNLVADLAKEVKSNTGGRI